MCVVVVVCNNGTRRKRLGLWREPHADGPLLLVIVVVLISSIVQQKKKTKGESVCRYEKSIDNLKIPHNGNGGHLWLGVGVVNDRNMPTLHYFAISIRSNIELQLTVRSKERSWALELFELRIKRNKAIEFPPSPPFLLSVVWYKPIRRLLLHSFIQLLHSAVVGRVAEKLIITPTLIRIIRNWDSLVYRFHLGYDISNVIIKIIIKCNQKVCVCVFRLGRGGNL